MHLFGGCFDIFPSRIVVVEWCYTITILASLFILYFFSILATLLTTSFCAVFVGFLFMDILGLLGAESRSPNVIRDKKGEKAQEEVLVKEEEVM